MADPILIIGGGHGGAQMAASLRQEGVDAPVMLISDEASLPYHRPPLSKAFLKDDDAKPQLLRPEAFYRDNSVELIAEARASAIDRAARRLTLADGTHIPYSHLVLATGARARLPAIDGLDLESVVTLRTLADANRLRDLAENADTIVVIGGGYIGMETAFTFAGRGKSVTLLEAAPAILGRGLAPIVSEHMTRRAKEAGIDIKCGVTIEALEGDGGKVAGVRLASGEKIAADAVVIGIGVIPNVELAAESGLSVDGGVLVNAHMQTGDLNVFAIGDCASYQHWHAGRLVRLESVQNASDQAKHAAKTIAGKRDDYRAVPWFWSDMGDSKIQMAGLSFDADTHVLSGDPEDNAFAVYHFAGTRLLSVDSVNRPADHMLGRKMLSAGFSPDFETVRAGTAAVKAALAAYNDISNG